MFTDKFQRMDILEPDEESLILLEQLMGESVSYRTKYIFENMDSKHTYEKIIADAYIENNDFFLTDEQRDLAYAEYKKTRE